MTASDLIDYAEQHVESFLASTGYHCTKSRPHHGAVDIEARGEEENLVVHVVASLAPAEVPDITTADGNRVVSRAMSLGFDAWLAKVQVDGEGQQVGDIQWLQLNH